jgi:ABC-type branched-subunit amino acid transport system permease subunit/aromatic ring-opening dioxygenase catalytic subunit (LigB family)
MIRPFVESLHTLKVGGPLLVVLAAILVLLPAGLAADSYLLHLLFTFFVFATLGHAWNLLAGFCGLLSFGNQVFIGIGGFILAILFYYGGLGVWAAMFLGGAASAAFAWLLAIPIAEHNGDRRILRPLAVAVFLWVLYEILLVYEPALDIADDPYVRRVLILLVLFLGALPLLKLQGAYFAVATWLIAEAVATVFNEWRTVGAGGGMQIKSTVSLAQLYYAGLILMVIATLAVWRVLRSRYGLALTAVRDNEEAAHTVGIDVRRVKSMVFILSGALTGLAGGLYYIDAVIITPPSAFAVTWSAYFVFIVVAGGMGTLAGPIIGAALYVILDRLLTGWIDQGLLILGAASILLILFLPRGVMGIISDLRRPARERGVSGDPATNMMRLLFGISGRAKSDAAPGVVAAFLVPGSPLPLMRPDNPAWASLLQGYAKAQKALAAAKPDVLLIYSTQWMAVLDQLWQTRPRVTGIHVDENWHELGNLRFDIRIDTDLAEACVKASLAAGIPSKGVDYDGFPIDTGTIVANALINTDGKRPVVLAANNIYHDWDTTWRLGELAVTQAIDQGKRVAIVAVGGLSGNTINAEIDFADDRFGSGTDDVLNREFLSLLEAGDIDEILRMRETYARDASADMGLKHIAWIFGALGNRFSQAVVHGYGPVYGAGAAVVEFKV